MSSDSPGAREEYAPPPHQSTTWMVLGTAFILAVGLASLRLAQNPDSPRPHSVLRELPPDEPAVLMDRPEMDDEYWPCSDCHEGEPTNFDVREMDEEHDELEFSHGTLWCLDCHDVEERDELHLANGALVDFDESWKLCTQCHGKKLDDWRAGVHGKRTGHWNGPKEYRPCVTCHNPHDPPFEAITPKPAPLHPEQIVMPGTEIPKMERAPKQAEEGAHDEH